MIPFQTILALLAVLLMFGCSANPPPKPGMNGQTGVTTSPTPTPTPADRNTVEKDPTINVKPEIVTSIDPDATFFKFDATTPGQLTAAFIGQDAERMYKALELLPQPSKPVPASNPEIPTLAKVGQNILCTQSSIGDYACAVGIVLVDGTLPENQDHKNVSSKPAYAQFHPQKQLSGTYFNFNANLAPETKEATPYFQINFFYANAKQLYEALQVGDVNGRKRGKRVDCTRDLKLGMDDLKAYHCILYGNLSTGSFDEIAP